MLEYTGIFEQQSTGAGGGAPPTVVSVTVSEIASGTTHNVAMPATVASGDLLLICSCSDGGTRDVTTAASGWSRIYSGQNGNCTVGYMVKSADGTEGGTTVNVTTNVTEYLASLIFRIQDWSGNLANIAVGTEIAGTNELTPPSLTSGFGAVPTLWICSISYSANVTLTTAPANYTGSSAGVASSSNGQIFTGHRQLTAASESPGAFSTSSPAANALLNTIAIRGTG